MMKDKKNKFITKLSIAIGSLFAAIGFISAAVVTHAETSYNYFFTQNELESPYTEIGDDNKTYTAVPFTGFDQRYFNYIAFADLTVGLAFNSTQNYQVNTDYVFKFSYYIERYDSINVTNFNNYCVSSEFYFRSPVKRPYGYDVKLSLLIQDCMHDSEEIDDDYILWLRIDDSLGYNITFDTTYYSDFCSLSFCALSDDTLTKATYLRGYNAGYNAGLNAGSTSDYDSIYNFAYNEGYRDGNMIGTEQGFNDGVSSVNTQSYYDQGYADATVYYANNVIPYRDQQKYDQGFAAGVNSVGSDISASYNAGYAAGYAEGRANVPADGTTNGKDLLWTIASTPFESFKTIFDFEILGVNISAFVFGVLTVGVVIVLVKKFIL